MRNKVLNTIQIEHTMTIKRIGFACKLSVLQKGECVSIPEANSTVTTVAWMSRQAKFKAEEKLWDMMKWNIEAARQLVLAVSKFEPELRMVRLTSDILQFYTHADWSWFYKQADVISYMEREFAKVGSVARAGDVRLSFHPGQFCVLASESDQIIQNSIEEFEYHADMASMMGYGKSFQDFKINVHISGKRGPDGFRQTWSRLSDVAKNCITVENEENSWGLLSTLELSDIVPTVLDVHHHWCREGEYISAQSDDVKRVVESWRGVRPTMHYSISREDLLTSHEHDVLPNMKELLAAGYKKQKLRAHSDMYWNTAVNQWVKTFRDDFDIMCESKYKNIASFAMLKEIS